MTTTLLDANNSDVDFDSRENSEFEDSSDNDAIPIVTIKLPSPGQNISNKNNQNVLLGSNEVTNLMENETFKTDKSRESNSKKDSTKVEDLKNYVMGQEKYQNCKETAILNDTEIQSETHLNTEGVSRKTKPFKISDDKSQPLDSSSKVNGSLNNDGSFENTLTSKKCTDLDTYINGNYKEKDNIKPKKLIKKSSKNKKDLETKNNELNDESKNGLENGETISSIKKIRSTKNQEKSPRNDKDISKDLNKYKEIFNENILIKNDPVNERKVTSNSELNGQIVNDPTKYSTSKQLDNEMINNYRKMTQLENNNENINSFNIDENINNNSQDFLTEKLGNDEKELTEESRHNEITKCVEIENDFSEISQEKVPFNNLNESYERKFDGNELMENKDSKSILYTDSDEKFTKIEQEMEEKYKLSNNIDNMDSENQSFFSKVIENEDSDFIYRRKSMDDFIKKILAEAREENKKIKEETSQNKEFSLNDPKNPQKPKLNKNNEPKVFKKFDLMNKIEGSLNFNDINENNLDNIKINNNAINNNDTKDDYENLNKYFSTKHKNGINKSSIEESDNQDEIWLKSMSRPKIKENGLITEDIEDINLLNRKHSRKKSYDLNGDLSEDNFLSRFRKERDAMLHEDLFESKHKEATKEIVQERTKSIRKLIDHQLDIVNSIKSESKNFDELEKEIRDVRQISIDRRARLDAIENAVNTEYKMYEIEQKAAHERTQNKRPIQKFTAEVKEQLLNSLQPNSKYKKQGTGLGLNIHGNERYRSEPPDESGYTMRRRTMSISSLAGSYASQSIFDDQESSSSKQQTNDKSSQNGDLDYYSYNPSDRRKESNSIRSRLSLDHNNFGVGEEPALEPISKYNKNHNKHLESSLISLLGNSKSRSRASIATMESDSLNKNGTDDFLSKMRSKYPFLNDKDKNTESFSVSSFSKDKSCNISNGYISAYGNSNSGASSNSYLEAKKYGSNTSYLDDPNYSYSRGSSPALSYTRTLSPRGISPSNYTTPYASPTYSANLISTSRYSTSGKDYSAGNNYIPNLTSNYTKGNNLNSGRLTYNASNYSSYNSRYKTPTNTFSPLDPSKFRRAASIADVRSHDKPPSLNIRGGNDLFSQYGMQSNSSNVKSSHSRATNSSSAGEFKSRFLNKIREKRASVGGGTEKVEHAIKGSVKSNAEKSFSINGYEQELNKPSVVITENE